MDEALIKFRLQKVSATSVQYLVLRHRKFHQDITRKFRVILAQKIESFKNVATIFKISAKIVISTICQK